MLTKKRLRNAYSKWEYIDELLNIETQYIKIPQMKYSHVNTRVNFLDRFYPSNFKDKVAEINKIVEEYSDVAFIKKRKIIEIPDKTRTIKVYSSNGKSVRKLNANIEEKIQVLNIELKMAEIAIEKVQDKQSKAFEELQTKKHIIKITLESMEDFKKQGFTTITQGFYPIKRKIIRCFDKDLNIISKDLNFKGGILLPHDDIKIINVKTEERKRNSNYIKTIVILEKYGNIHISKLE